jgi:polyphosphate kinase 2
MSGAQKRGKTKRAKELLRDLQVELVKLQRHAIERGHKILLIVEGRDAAGKDGAIKTLVRHMSPRETRVFAPSKPSEQERSAWYFQRFVPHLPAGGEFVVFNRSWYNRAGVERVMRFCTPEETRAFLHEVPAFERMLARSGIRLVKVYLDVSRKEQAKRLADRKRDPLKRWKASPIDECAQRLWKAYSKARDAMLSATSDQRTPWVIVPADDKDGARLELLRVVLRATKYPKKRAALLRREPGASFVFDARALGDGRLAR